MVQPLQLTFLAVLCLALNSTSPLFPFHCARTLSMRVFLRIYVPVFYMRTLFTLVIHVHGHVNISCMQQFVNSAVNLLLRVE
jgi:hypothetical protein